MAEVSRALARHHYDRAFVLVAEGFGGSQIAAAFLLASGVPVEELPRGAQRAIVDAADGAA